MAEEKGPGSGGRRTRHKEVSDASKKDPSAEVKKHRSLNELSLEAPAGLMGNYLGKGEAQIDADKKAEATPVTCKRGRASGSGSAQQEKEARPKKQRVASKVDTAETDEEQLAQGEADAAKLPASAQKTDVASPSKRSKRIKAASNLTSEETGKKSQLGPLKTPQKTELGGGSASKRSTRKNAPSTKLKPEDTARKTRRAGITGSSLQADAVVTKKKKSAAKLQEDEDEDATSPRRSSRAVKQSSRLSDKWMQGLSSPESKSPRKDVPDSSLKRTRGQENAEQSALVSPPTAAKQKKRSAKIKSAKDPLKADGELIWVHAGDKKFLQGTYDFSTDQISTEVDGETCMVGPKAFLRLADSKGSWEDNIYVTAQEGYDEQGLGAWLKAACQVCQRPTDEASLLVCDGCELNYHMGCLKPAIKKIPKNDWFCPGCKK